MEMTMKNPSTSVTAGEETIPILPPDVSDQVMEGVGSPLAIHVNETTPLSFPVIAMSAGGSVIPAAPTWIMKVPLLCPGGKVELEMATERLRLLKLQ